MCGITGHPGHRCCVFGSWQTPKTWESERPSEILKPIEGKEEIDAISRKPGAFPVGGR